MRTRGCTPSYKLKLKRCTQHRFGLIISSWVHTSIQGARVSPWWEHWLEHSPPTNVAQASSPGVDAICGLALFLVLSFARRVFFWGGFPVFFPPPTIYFSLGRKWLIHKRSQKKIEIFWFFWLQFCSLRGRCSKGNRKGILGRGGR